MISLLRFVEVLTRVAVHVDLEGHHALERAGQLVEDTAKEAIGTYAFGWPPLKPETIARKTTGDSPLLETGALRDSIGHTVIGNHRCEVGSNDPKAEYHELGTATIPPRSFLVSAAMEKEAEVVKLLGESGVRALMGEAGPLPSKP
jgi:phage gpG-like protein